MNTPHVKPETAGERLAREEEGLSLGDVARMRSAMENRSLAFKALTGGMCPDEVAETYGWDAYRGALHMLPSDWRARCTERHGH